MAEIEISLFKTLDKVSELLKVDENKEEEEDFVLRMHKIENNLETFIENFFLQFFNYGFDLYIVGLTVEALSEVESHFEDFKGSPLNMVASFKEAIEILYDLEIAVYLDPPRNEDLYDAYMDFLPELFESFKKDEPVLVERIKNYGKIKVRMEGILSDIDKMKKQRKLS